MSKQKTHEEFVKEVNEKYGIGEYTILTTYTGALNKVYVQHNACGRTFWIRASNFIKGERIIGCPYCSVEHGNQLKCGPQKTPEEFRQEVYDLVGDEYLVLEDYKGAGVKILFKHNILECSNTFYMTPNGFLTGSRCPKCSIKAGHEKLSKKFMKTKEQFLEDIKNKFKGKIILIGEYIDSYTPTEFYCVKHEVNFTNTPRNVYRSKTGCCPECALNKGDDCYKWKGGESELKDIVRHFDKEWQIATNDFYNHRCIINRKSTDVVIHHIWKSFSDIYQELLDELGYEYNTQRKDLTDEELEKIRECTIRLHMKYGLGIPINRQLHEEFHKQYGTINNTPEQFIEFAHNKGVELEINTTEQGIPYLLKKELV